MDDVRQDIQEYIGLAQPEYIVIGEFISWRLVCYPDKRMPRLGDVGTILRAMGYHKRLIHLRRRQGEEPGLAEMRWYAGQ